MTVVSLTVNGRAIQADVPPRLHLADFLREKLLLTGTHIGCEHGICGACTVEIDGEIARSCLAYTVACDGSEVRTIEGFDADALMERLRQAFSRDHALQCGYCTPGMLIAARDLLQRKTGLDRAAIRTEMSGNLCRCTGYVGIIDAVARLMDEHITPIRPVSKRLGSAPSPIIPAATGATAARGPSAAPPPVSPSPPPAGRSRQNNQDLVRLKRRAPIKVTVDPVIVDKGTTYVRQTFKLDHPREAVWQLLRDPVKAASLVPGVRLDTIQDDRVSGQLAIRLGPIRATFVGQGTVLRADDAYRQVIAGRGDDRGSGSIAEGQIACSLQSIEGVIPAATNIEIALSYSLRGPLAQFGRVHLIRDVVAQIGEQCAGNLDAALSNDTAPGVAPAELAPLPLLWKAFLRQLMRRLSGGHK